MDGFFISYQTQIFACDPSRINWTATGAFPGGFADDDDEYSAEGLTGRVARSSAVTPRKQEATGRGALVAEAEKIDFDYVLRATFGFRVGELRLELLKVEVQRQPSGTFRRSNRPVMHIQRISGSPVGPVIEIGPGLRVVVLVAVEDSSGLFLGDSVDHDGVRVLIELGSVSCHVTRSFYESSLIVTMAAHGHFHQQGFDFLRQGELPFAQSGSVLDVMTLHAVGPAPVAGIAVTAGIVDLGCPHDFFRRLAFVEIEVQPDGVASCRGRVEPAVVQPELRVPGEHEGIFRDIYPEGLAPTAVERVSVWGERPCQFVPLTVCLVAHKKHGCVVVGSWSFEETCHSIGDDDPFIFLVLREYKVEGEVLFLAPAEEMQLQFVTADLGGRLV